MKISSHQHVNGISLNREEIDLLVRRGQINQFKKINFELVLNRCRGLYIIY